MRRRTNLLRLLCALAALFPCLGNPIRAAADDTNNLPPDKSGYSLFHPVPRELMRELTPDRPDKTEGPFTVDAGHYQLEMDFAIPPGTSLKACGCGRGMSRRSI